MKIEGGKNRRERQCMVVRKRGMGRGVECKRRGQSGEDEGGMKGEGMWKNKKERRKV